MDTNVGVVSFDEDWKDEEDDPVEKARKEGNIENESFGILFTSTDFNFRLLAEEIEDEINSEWIGGTTIAEITEDGPSEGTAVFMLVESDEIEFTALESDTISDNAEPAAETAARKVEEIAEDEERNEIVFSLIPGLTLGKDGREFKFLKGLEKKLETDIKIVGGSTGDGHRLVENYQIKNGRIYADKAVMAVIQTEHEIVTGQEHGFEKDIATGVVTGADGRIIKKISGEPAVEFYSDKTGVPVDELTKIYNVDLIEKLKAGLYYLKLKLKGEDPSMVHEVLRHSLDYAIGQEIMSGEYKVISPLEIKGEGIKMIDAVKEGQTIKILEGERERIVNAGAEAFSELEPENTLFGVLVDCANRHILLDEDEREQEVEKAVECLGDKTVGFYGEGEIGEGGVGICTYMSQTITGFAVEKE